MGVPPGGQSKFMLVFCHRNMFLGTPLCQSLTFVIFLFNSINNPIQFPKRIIVWVVAAAKTCRRKNCGRKITLLTEEENASSLLRSVKLLPDFYVDYLVLLAVHSEETKGVDLRKEGRNSDGDAQRDGLKKFVTIELDCSSDTT